MTAKLLIFYTDIVFALSLLFVELIHLFITRFNHILPLRFQHFFLYILSLGFFFFFLLLCSLLLGNIGNLQFSIIIFFDTNFNNSYYVVFILFLFICIYYLYYPCSYFKLQNVIIN